MAFRFKKSVPVAYEQQGYIYFVSKLCRQFPVGTQRQITKLCKEAGGEHYQALFEFVTTDNGAKAVCTKYYLSESTLERIVRRYYKLFSESL